MYCTESTCCCEADGVCCLWLITERSCGKCSVHCGFLLKHCHIVISLHTQQHGNVKSRDKTGEIIRNKCLNNCLKICKFSQILFFPSCRLLEVSTLSTSLWKTSTSLISKVSPPPATSQPLIPPSVYRTHSQAIPDSIKTRKLRLALRIMWREWDRMVMLINIRI